MSRPFHSGLGRGVHLPLWGALAALPAVCGAAPLPAPHQAPAAHKAPAPPAAKPDTILGVAINADLDDVHAILARQGVRAGMGADSPAGDEDKDAGEGHKEAWNLKGTPFSQVAIGADGTDRVQWVTAFVRPGQDMPFARIKPMAGALGSTPMRVVWSGRSGGDSYALVASGANGKARLLQLFRVPARRYGVNERPPEAPAAPRMDPDAGHDAAASDKHSRKPDKQQ